MTNWHHNNPIMTTEQPVTLPELLAELTLNGSQDCRRFDLRIDSEGRIWSRIGVSAKTPSAVDRDGSVIYSDTRRDFDTDCGKLSDYYRNYFGAIVRRCDEWSIWAAR